MKKAILSLLVLFYAICLNAQSLQFRHDTLDVGLTTWYRPIKGIFRFKNVSNNTIRIAEVDPGCGCLLPDYPAGDIRPGEEGRVVITYNSEMLGQFDRLILVRVEGEMPQLLRMKCKVVSEEVEQQPQIDEEETIAQPDRIESEKTGPRLGIPTDYLDIGKYKKNKKLKGNLIIKNEGTDVLLVDAITSKAEALTIKATHVALQPGQMYTVKITLDTAKLPNPEVKCLLTIESNDTSRPSCPVYVFCK